MKKLFFLFLLIPVCGFAQLSDATLLLHDSTQIKQLGPSQVRSWQMFKEVIQNKINFGTNTLTQNLNFDGAFNVRWGDTTVPLSIFDVVAGNSGYTQFSKALLNINTLDLTHIESSSTIAEVLLNSTGVHIVGGIGGGSPHTSLDLTGTSALFTDTRATPVGLQEAADYSGTYTARSYASKAYVDSHVTTAAGLNQEVQTSNGSGVFTASGLYANQGGGTTFLNTAVGNNILALSTEQVNMNGTLTLGFPISFAYPGDYNGATLVAGKNNGLTAANIPYYPLMAAITRNSGTVGPGFGVGMSYSAQNTSNIDKIIGTTSYVLSNTTNTIESADFILSNISAGTLTERLRVTSAGAIGLSGANYGTAGQTIISGGSGAAVTWGAGGGTPGGSTTQVQFNLVGAFAGNANFTINNGTGVVTFGQLPTIPVTPVASTDAASKGYVDGLTTGPFSTVAAGYVNASGGAGYIIKGDNSGLAPGTLGNVLSSDGTSWVSSLPALYGYTTTVTAAGTTTLTASSTYKQHFTGTTTQNIDMPVTSTLSLGRSYFISNVDNTGALTVRSSGANTIQTMAAGSALFLTCVLTSGTTAASWSIMYYPLYPLTTVGDMMVGGTVVNGYATPTRLAAGSVSGYVLTSNGSGVAPSWQVAGGISGLTAGRIPIATSSTVLGDDAGLSYSTSTRTMILGLTSSGSNTLQLGVTGNGFIMSNSSGEFRMSTSSGGYFPTFYANGGEAARISSPKNFSIGSTTDNAKLYVVQAALSSAWIPAFRVDPGAHTAMTAGTEFSVNVFTGSTQTWANGSSTLATQRYNYFKAPTVNAGTGNTITDTFNGYFELPTNGTGTTTNLYAFGTNGAIKIGGGLTVTGSIKFSGTNSTGATTAALSTNSPAVTGTAPYTWITVITSDGSTGYIPVWK